MKIEILTITLNEVSIPSKPHHFSEALKQAREQARRKYGRRKGKATRGLTTDSLFPEVAHRPLAEYEAFSRGGVVWNN